MKGEANIVDLLLKCNYEPKIDETKPYIETYMEIAPRKSREEVQSYLQALLALSRKESRQFTSILEDENIDELVQETSLILLFYKISHYLPNNSRLHIYEKHITVKVAVKLIAVVMTYLLMDSLNNNKRALRGALRAGAYQAGFGNLDLPPLDKGYTPEQYQQKIELLRLLGSITLKGSIRPLIVPFILDYILCGEYRKIIVDEFSSSISTEKDPENVENLATFWNKLMPAVAKQRLGIIYFDASKSKDFQSMENTKRALILLGAAQLLTDITKIEGDVYNVSQAGAVGPNSNAQDTIFYNIETSINMQELAEELLKLRQAMKEQATEDDHDIAIGNIAKAEQLAKSGDTRKVFDYLKSVGNWTLEVATKIGTSVAAEAIKISLGLN